MTVLANLSISGLNKISRKFLKEPEPRGSRLLTEALSVHTCHRQTDRQTVGSRAQSITARKAKSERRFKEGVRSKDSLNRGKQKYRDNC